jgi:hypothetical protein
LHVVGAANPVKIEVTRMVTDADRPLDLLDPRPYVVAVSAWTDHDLMTSFETAEFDAAAKIFTRAMGVVGKKLDDPKALKSRWKA